MTSNDEEQSRTRWLVGIVMVLACPVLIIYWPGCRQYPPVSSREALKIMQLLNSACNTKDAKRLADAKRRLAELDRQGKLSPKERASFEKILSWAEAEQWEIAEAAAFKMAQDQVGVGHPDPDDHPKHLPKSNAKK